MKHPRAADMTPDDRLYYDHRNVVRAARRRALYAADPIWRLTKLKDTWERRERVRRARGAGLAA